MRELRRGRPQHGARAKSRSVLAATSIDDTRGLRVVLLARGRVRTPGTRTHFGPSLTRRVSAESTAPSSRDGIGVHRRSVTRVPNAPRVLNARAFRPHGPRADRWRRAPRPLAQQHHSHARVSLIGFGGQVEARAQVAEHAREGAHVRRASTSASAKTRAAATARGAIRAEPMALTDIAAAAFCSRAEPAHRSEHALRLTRARSATEFTASRARRAPPWRRSAPRDTRS